MMSWPQSNVVKTGPDRPVQPVGPETGPSTGPDKRTEPLVCRTAEKTVKTGMNRCEPDEPVNRSRFWKTGRFQLSFEKQQNSFIFSSVFHFFFFILLPFSIF
jgi:hypothetical protein